MLATTLYKLMGDDDNARHYSQIGVERALELNPSDPATRYNVACFHAQYSDPDRALDCLRDSVIAPNWSDNDPDLDPLREHLRYREILESLPE